MSTPAPKRPQAKGSHCHECRGHRLHTVRVIRSPSGKVTRDLICSACESVTRWGLCCPKCGDVRLDTLYTRHRSGTTVRVKSCLTCGHRVRTRETIEAGAG